MIKKATFCDKKISVVSWYKVSFWLNTRPSIKKKLKIKNIHTLEFKKSNLRFSIKIC